VARQPTGPIYLSSLVLSVGTGAWVTCWAVFFTRSLGLSPAQFGIGVTAAGFVGMAAGGPIGVVADRLGARETLMVLGVVEALTMFAYAFVHGPWAVLPVTSLMVAVGRSASGVRYALISGLVSGQERLKCIATTHVMTQGGLVGGAVAGGIVLSLDDRAGFLGLTLLCGVVNLVAALMLLAVPHVESLSDRKVKRKVVVLRDRPFLTLTLLNGILALNWGMLDSGLPLWITRHTSAPPWTLGALLAFNATVVVLFTRRVTREGASVAGAGRLGLWSGIVLAACCALYAATARGALALVLVILLAAATVHVIGELFFVGSGFGISVGLTREDAHGEYQSAFTTGQSAAMTFAPAIMTLLLVVMGVAGWAVLAALYLGAGLATPVAVRWALRTRAAPEAAPEGERVPSAQGLR
jgi:MFS family permease